MESEEGDSAPRVWMLLGERLGDNAQIRSLAQRLGYPAEEKFLRFNKFYHIPSIVTGPSLLSLAKVASTRLRPPWPDAIILCGRKSVPVALWIRRKSGGHTKLIAIGRPRAPLNLFDAILTTPQYRLPSAPNVSRLPAPLSGIGEEDLEHGRRLWGEELSAYKKPRIALLVGGDTSTCRLDTVAADRLGRLASTYVRERQGTLLVSTSPRTQERAVRALVDALTVPARLHIWEPKKIVPNPYVGYLAMADEIIVTTDSASMMSDASAAGKPVLLFDVPMRPRNIVLWLQHRLYRTLEDAEAVGKPLRLRDRLLRWLAYQGILTPPRNMQRLFNLIVARHKAGWLVDACVDVVNYQAPSSQGLFDEVDEFVERIRKTISSDRRS